MSGENTKAPTIEAALAKIGLAGSKRHVFFCMHGDCAPKEVSEASWKYLKKRLREVGETHPFIVGADGVQRYFTVMAECALASKLRAGAK